MSARRERAAGRGALVLHADFASPAATSPRVSSELEQARPQTSGEEELQLQLALAMSREVAEQVGAGRDARPRGEGPGHTHMEEGLSLVGPGDASVRGASWKRSRLLGWAPSQVSTAPQRRVQTMICTVGREHLDPEEDETEAGRKCPGDEIGRASCRERVSSPV